MRKLINILTPLILLMILASACSDSAPALPSNSELSSDASTPVTEVTFLVAPPLGTDSSAKLSLVLLDLVAGQDIQTRELPMSPTSDGRYEVKLTVPVGSMLNYRYIRIAPAEAVEVTTGFNLVDFRVAHIPGPTHIEETIAGWSDVPFNGTSGRIIGRILNLETGRGQRELLVSAGGVTTYTEADGTFRIDGLPEGLHYLTAFSPDGAFLPAGQGALIAAGTTTPAELQVRKAKLIYVTFQLTVPEDLNPEVVMRLTGNLSTLGNRFSDLGGGVRVSVAHMPTMVQVDPRHYLAVLSLYAGSDLRYKYTLGDGLWNAERNAEGALLTRQMILPEQDVVLRDSVASWGAPGTPPVRFTVRVPESTPADDQISLQFNPLQGFEALPMWPLSPGTWYLDFYGPLTKGVDIQYRYCRNLQCGSADDTDTAGLEANGRSLAYQGQAILREDEVREWRWLGETPASTPITAIAAAPRPELLTGVEIAPGYRSSWRNGLMKSGSYIRSLGANSIILPIEWNWMQQNPFPILSLDPAHTPFSDELRNLNQAAQGAGLKTILKANPSADGIAMSTWWETASRDRDWWQLWFDEYSLFARTAADTASELGVEALVLGGEWTAPALPGGRLPGGGPSGVPADAEARWRTLLDDIRARYGGRVIFELGLGTDIPEMPNFLDSVDAIGLHWQVPLTPDTQEDVHQMAEDVASMLDMIDAQIAHFERPLWIAIEYASVRGGAAACPPAPDGSCRPIELFAGGQDVDPDLEVAASEQAEAINAVILAAYDRPNIQGIFIAGFNPASVLWDKSSSIYGKPAEEVLRYWYPRLGGDS
ncbi:MAG: hypothetical protein E4G99_07510 [Anaerolineales bacterium]|nr:MAG: hypothetical protein E4G99_07510 [Anaerolineales bacterium]